MNTLIKAVIRSPNWLNNDLKVPVNVVTVMVWPTGDWLVDTNPQLKTQGLIDGFIEKDKGYEGDPWRAGRCWLAGRQTNSQEKCGTGLGRDKRMINLRKCTAITYRKSGADTNTSSWSLKLAMMTGKPGLKYCGADEGMSCMYDSYTGRMEYEGRRAGINTNTWENKKRKTWIRPGTEQLQPKIG